MKSESLEVSKDADMNILSPIFWVICKLDWSAWPDHICHWAVQCARSNYTTFKNFKDVFGVAFAVMMLFGSLDSFEITVGNLVLSMIPYVTK